MHTDLEKPSPGVAETWWAFEEKGFWGPRCSKTTRESVGSWGLARSHGAGAQGGGKLKSREKNLTLGKPGCCPGGGGSAGVAPVAGPTAVCRAAHPEGQLGSGQQQTKGAQQPGARGG